MKLVDLPTDRSIVGVKVKVPKEVAEACGFPAEWGYIESWWMKGFWVTVKPGAERAYPLCFETLDEMWGIEYEN
jgi:hypothetical protein